MEYLKCFGTIILVYTSVINLSLFKFKAKELILLLCITEVISSVLFFGGEFSAMLPVLILPIIFLYKKDKRILKSISISTISFLIVIMIDYAIANICILVFDIDAIQLKTNITSYWINYAVALILVFAITKLLGIIINRKAAISNLKLKGKLGLLIVFSLILTLVIFYINIISQSNNGSSNEIIKLNGILFFAYFILLLIIMHILFRSISKEFEFKNRQSQFENLQEYTNNLEKLFADMRVFRHDYINILSSMVGYIQDKDIEGLEKHFNNNIIPISKGMESNNFKLELLSNIKTPEIKGIFSSKLIRAQELGIDVFIDITELIEEINMDIIDLSRSIGILLDNAIEAAQMCVNPSIKVALINNKSYVLIVIINSCNEDIPPIYKIYQQDFSTKGKNRGIGLNSLKEIIGKYTHVSLDTIIENGEFKQLIQIAKNRV